MNETILITGATGLLGRALTRAFTNNPIIKCSSKTFDITNAEATADFIVGKKPEIIIHCAAIGSVDKVQSDVVNGCAVNLGGTYNVIKAAEMIKAKLVFISTNAVFDGRSPLYNEDSLLCPISNYGIIKAAAEFAVRSSKLQWMIMRPILMYGHNYGGHRSNWVTMWAKMLGEKQQCLVVDDVITQPLYNYDCAGVIAKAVRYSLWNQIFNIGGEDRCSLFQFAQKVAEVLELDKSLIKPVPSSHFNNIAPRPRDTSYDLTKIKTLLRHNPLCIYDGLKEMQKEQTC